MDFEGSLSKLQHPGKEDMRELPTNRRPGAGGWLPCKPIRFLETTMLDVSAAQKTDRGGL